MRLVAGHRTLSTAQQQVPPVGSGLCYCLPPCCSPDRAFAPLPSPAVPCRFPLPLPPPDIACARAITVRCAPVPCLAPSPPFGRSLLLSWFVGAQSDRCRHWWTLLSTGRGASGDHTLTHNACTPHICEHLHRQGLHDPAAHGVELAGPPTTCQVLMQGTCAGRCRCSCCVGVRQGPQFHPPTRRPPRQAPPPCSLHMPLHSTPCTFHAACPSCEQP